MPELPEVETIVRGLRPLAGGRIVAIETLDDRLALDDEGLVGSHLVDVQRRGKYIVLQLSGGRSLIVHLRMSGRLVLSCCDEELPYVRLRIVLERGTISFVNPRRLGTVEIVTGPFPHELGVDPLSEAFTPEALEQLLRSTQRPIKPALTDQRRLAGLGNIYAAEALWRAGIAPGRRAHRVGRRRIRGLHGSIVDVLNEAIRDSGTSFGVSISDYRDAHGEDGAFRARLAVYGKAGQPCQRCGTLIARCTQAGRSTYWCPQCQR